MEEYMNYDSLIEELINKSIQMVINHKIDDLEEILNELVNNHLIPLRKIRDINGNTILHWAAISSTELLKNVLKFSTPNDVNSVDMMFGETPLIWAASNEMVDNIDFLIEKGADISIKAKDGITAYKAAIKYGHQEMVEKMDYYHSKSNLEKLTDINQFVANGTLDPLDIQIAKNNNVYLLSELDNDSGLDKVFSFDTNNAVIEYYEENILQRALARKGLGITWPTVNGEKFQLYKVEEHKYGKIYLLNGKFQEPFFKDNKIHIPVNTFSYLMQLPKFNKEVSLGNDNLPSLDETEVHEHVHAEDYKLIYNDLVLPWIKNLILFLKQNEDNINSSEELSMKLSNYYKKNGDIDLIFNEFAKQLRNKADLFHNSSAGREVAFDGEERRLTEGNPSLLYQYIKEKYPTAVELNNLAKEAQERYDIMSKLREENRSSRPKTRVESKSVNVTSTLSNQNLTRAILKLISQLQKKLPSTQRISSSHKELIQIINAENAVVAQKMLSDAITNFCDGNTMLESKVRNNLFEANILKTKPLSNVTEKLLDKEFKVKNESNESSEEIDINLKIDEYNDLLKHKCLIKMELLGLIYSRNTQALNNLKNPTLKNLILDGVISAQFCIKLNESQAMSVINNHTYENIQKISREISGPIDSSLKSNENNTLKNK